MKVFEIHFMSTAQNFNGRGPDRSVTLLKIKQGVSLGKKMGNGRPTRRLSFFTKTRNYLSHLICALLVLTVFSACEAQDIILVHRNGSEAEEQAIRRMVDFYGLNLYTLNADSTTTMDSMMARLRNAHTLAVLISQNTLSGLDWKKVQMALMGPNRMGAPILVFGVAARQHLNELRFWSENAVQDCSPLPSGFRPSVLKVSGPSELTRALANLELPAVAAPTCSMRLNPTAAAQVVLAVHADDGTNAPVLIRSKTKTGDIFFVPKMEQFDMSWLGKSEDPPGPFSSMVGDMPKAFSSMAPFILFLSHVAGDYGWHLDGHYANLTIDDAWLTQPYGHLDYPALLRDMDKHNFHTTIAFIPWNFDRSDPQLVALIRAHPERFSLCVHGNNHSHREFGAYRTNSLQQQTADIKQAVARMEHFHTTTAIPYDRVMVFPHAVAPEGTFAELKSYGFLGTANLLNVPLGAGLPADPAFLLRPSTVAYANFLSLSRYSVSWVHRLDVAINSFLGNPLLFYDHQTLFENGIGAFDPIADLVNRVQPETQWTGLGELARHSHLIRRRADGGYDVWMFSNEMDLANPEDRDEVFYVRQQESASLAIRSLTIDGVPVPFKQAQDVFSLSLVIPSHQVRKVRLEYQNDFDLSHEDISKGSPYVYTLRWISDFRDLYLSRSSWGSAVTQAYYQHHWDSVELFLERKWWVVVTFAGLVLLGLVCHRRKTKLVTRRATVSRYSKVSG